MRKNPASHLDDLAQRFAATSPSRKPTANVKTGIDPQSPEAKASTVRSTKLLVTVALALLLLAALLGFFLMRR